MNIFVLDLDQKTCAEYHCDSHIVKMITEYNQILGSIAYSARGITRKKDITQEFIDKTFRGFPRTENGKTKPYGIGYVNHPCTKWAAASDTNYFWLCTLNLYMCKEYTKRYGRKHAGEEINNWYSRHNPKLPEIGLTPFPQAMPEDCKNPDVVKAYRDYYNKYKVKFAKWAHSEIPGWFEPQQLLITL